MIFSDPLRRFCARYVDFNSTTKNGDFKDVTKGLDLLIPNKNMKELLLTKSIKVSASRVDNNGRASVYMCHMGSRLDSSNKSIELNGTRIPNPFNVYDKTSSRLVSRRKRTKYDEPT